MTNLVEIRYKKSGGEVVTKTLPLEDNKTLIGAEYEGGIVSSILGEDDDIFVLSARLL